MSDLPLSHLQSELAAALYARGIRASWIPHPSGQRLTLGMLESIAPHSVHVSFASPLNLQGFHVVGWRYGTMEELKIARPVIYELCRLTRDDAQLARHRDFWSHTPMDWDGNPGGAGALDDPPAP